MNNKGYVHPLYAAIVVIIVLAFLPVLTSTIRGVTCEDLKEELNNCQNEANSLRSSLDVCRNDVNSLRSKSQEDDEKVSSLDSSLNECQENYNSLLNQYQIIFNKFNLLSKNISFTDYYIYIHQVRIHIIYMVLFSFWLGLTFTLNLIKIETNIEIKNIEIDKETVNYILGGVLLLIIILVVLSNLGLIL